MGRESPLADVERLCLESFVRHVECFERLGSTNNRAAELAGRRELPTPALVAARLQTAGRGRGSHTWWADDGALTFSLLLDTAAQGFTPRDWPRLSLTTAVAVCDAIQAECMEQEAGNSESIPALTSLPPAPCSIKWPNDVLIDGGKVCGILVESPGGPAPAKDRLIVGVGINVNNSWRSAPPEAGPSGTALCDITGRQHDLQKVLLGVLRALDHRLDQLASGNPQLSQVWQLLNLLIEQDVLVEMNGKRFEGRCVGIAVDGALVVETPRGAHRYYSGTVRSVNN